MSSFIKFVDETNFNVTGYRMYMITPKRTQITVAVLFDAYGAWASVFCMFCVRALRHICNACALSTYLFCVRALTTYTQVEMYGL